MKPEYQKALDDLQELIDFAYAEMGKVAIKEKYLKRKKKILMPVFVNACDLAGSVHILLSNERINAAEALLRNFQEVWLNTHFIFADGRRLWADAYLAESELGMKKWVDNTRKLRAKYPSADTSKSTFPDKKLDAIKKRSEALLNELQKRHPTIPSIPDVSTRDITKKPYSLRDKTVILDYLVSQQLAKKGKKLDHSREWDYLLIYKYFSGVTHVDARYINSLYLAYSKAGMTILKHGKIESLGVCVLTAYGFLVDMLDVFSKQFGYPKSANMKPYRQKLKELFENTPK